MTITPDSGIKNTTVLPSGLPRITKDGKYLVRYRIVSEDKSVSSAWSPHRLVMSMPVFSATSSDKTILNPLGSGSPKYEVSAYAKSHGKSFDVSWKINNTITDLVEIPKPLDGISYDSYVRWGTNVVSISGPVSDVYTITTELPPNVPVGETIVLETLAGVKVNFLVTESDATPTTTPYSFKASKITVSSETTFALMWTPWEYISTISSNSFSVPIPDSHQSTTTIKGYAEFMVHVYATTKDLDEYNYQTRLFYSEHISTQGTYDSTALPTV